MKRLRWALFATAAILVTPGHAEEFDPSFIGDGIVEMLRAHGFDSAARGEARMLADGSFEIDQVTAGLEGIGHLEIGRLMVRDVADEEGERAWFRLGRLEAYDVSARWSGYTGKAASFAVSDLRLLNLNEADGDSGYENIDGAFSAARFATAAVDGIFVEFEGKPLLHGTAVAVQADGWWPEPSFPTAAGFTVSGAAFPQSVGIAGWPAKTEFKLTGRASIDTAVRMGSVELFAVTGHGEAAASLGLAGLYTPAAKDMARWLMGAGPVPSGVQVTRFAAASRGTGWAADAAAAFAALLPPAAQTAGAAFARALSSEETAVLQASPPKPVPLSRIMGPGTVTEGEWGFR